VDKLDKKKKFIILSIIGGIIIVGAFIWSMIINLSQIKISNPIPEVDLPEFSELTNDIDKGNESNTTELEEMVEVLEKESSQGQNLQEENKEENIIDNNNTNLDPEPKQE
jgi:hypothetical protein